MERTQVGFPYPEINFQISSAAKFPIADLEGDGHLVVFVELLMETFSAMGAHLNIMP